MMPSLSDIDKLPVELIQDFRKTGSSKGIPAYLQRYIIELSKAAEIHEFEPNIKRAAKKLCEALPDNNLTPRTAQERLYDAITYFHLNNRVKNEAWDQYYADRLEDLAKLALAKDEISEARRCFLKAHELRTRRDENAIDPDKLRIKDQVISPDITADRLGLKEFNMKQLWKESLETIEAFDIETPHKERIKKEAAEVLGIKTDNEDEE